MKHENISPTVIAAFIDQSIRLLYNSSKLDFIKIFGEDGVYLWEKYTVHYNKNEGSFICYLDHENQWKLAVAVREFAIKEDPRLKT